MHNRDPYAFENDRSIPPRISNAIKTVLRSWDDSKTDYKYVSIFKPDGILHVLDLPSKGREEIRQLRATMIDSERGPVVGLQHYLDKLFVLPGQEPERIEVVFTGALTNVLKDGRQVTSDFASLVILSKSNERPGELQADYWRVFSDTSKLSAQIRLTEAKEASPQAAEEA